MNDTLQNIMLFINEHTVLLIGICVFLILVLVGYLIDNSVKSKRVRNDIKNKDQVPENIKEEIIEEAKKTKKFENAVMEKNELTKEEITPETKAFLEEQVDAQISNSPLNIDNNTEDNLLNLDEQNNLNLDSFATSNEIIDNDLIQDNLNPQPETIIDPDSNIMNVDNGFKNDKKLSEILSGVSNVYNNNQNNDLNNIVEESSIINDLNSKEDNTQNTINNNADDELDRIMRKLSSMNKIEDDNYTNIF